MGPDPKASNRQLRYIGALREEYDPLSAGSEMPTLKVGASAEIARLLSLKAKYEAGTRPPDDRKPKASGQFRYPQ